MIVEHTVQGSPATTLHDFSISQSGMDLIFSAGAYIRGERTLFQTENGATVSIQSSPVDTHYEIWLTEQGLTVLYREEGREFGDVQQPIDRLAWFTVPAYATTLDDMEIHVVKVVKAA